MVLWQREQTEGKRVGRGGGKAGGRRVFTLARNREEFRKKPFENLDPTFEKATFEKVKISLFEGTLPSKNSIFRAIWEEKKNSAE